MSLARPERGWYRGDCHVHSARSAGGELTPQQLVAAAGQVGLDFIAATEHNTCDTHDAWVALSGEALLVILGQEIVTGTGHWLALGIGHGQVVDWRYRVRDEVIGRHLDQVRHAGGLCVAAHPHAPYPGGVFVYPFDGFDAVEVWNGPWQGDQPWQADNPAALAEWARGLAVDVHRGRWRPAVGNSDTHLAGQLGIPHTVVLAEKLSTEAILAGIRAGRTWIAESATIHLSLHARAGDHSAGIGGHLISHGEPIVVRVEVRGVPNGTISFHTERGTVHRESLPGHGSGTVRWHTDVRETAFVRVEARHPTGHMAALTNPITFA